MYEIVGIVQETHDKSINFLAKRGVIGHCYEHHFADSKLDIKSGEIGVWQIRFWLHSSANPVKLPLYSVERKLVIQTFKDVKRQSDVLICYPMMELCR